jgi:hypothetical protein
MLALHRLEAAAFGIHPFRFAWKLLESIHFIFEIAQH